MKDYFQKVSQLLFNELDDLNKIKIFNKYAEYPKINYFDNSYFKNKAKIYIGKNYTPKIKSNLIQSIFNIAEIQV